MTIKNTVVSSFRHVYGEPAKADQSYNDVNVRSTTIDSNLLAANARFVALPIDSPGGGVFIVLNANGSGRVGSTGPTFRGHGNPVIDLAFNPFNDFIIASASEDATIRLWKVPFDDGEIKSQNESLAILKGHNRRASRVVFNPVVDNSLASFGLENSVKVWDISKGAAVITHKVGKENLLDISWSQDGNLLVYPAKDKYLHVLDVRASVEVFAVPGSPGIRGGRAVFFDKLNYIFSTGYSQNNSRQAILRDRRNPEKPLSSMDIDFSTGVLASFIDPDLGLVYTFARGDTTSRYFELREDSENYLLNFNGYVGRESFRGFAIAPKYIVDTSVCEIARFYVVTSGKVLHKLQYIVPRKNSDTFQEDLYPDTNAPVPAIGFDGWNAGENGTPTKISLRNGYTISNDANTFSVNQSESDDPIVLKEIIGQLQTKIRQLEAEIASLKHPK